MAPVSVVYQATLRLENSLRFDELRALVQALPEVVAWPELNEVFARAGDVPRPDWELPLLAADAVGGVRDSALPAAAALACLQVSIILVDDMLDHDPRGVYRLRGHGPTANLANGLQAAAFRLLESADVDAETHAAAATSLAHAALGTAAGQYLDVQNLEGEEEYWAVVLAKSTPFYGSALQIGALLGGGSPNLSRRLYELGVLIGEIIQIEDDLEDSLQVPANADWTQGRNNLLILYARSAEHKDKQRFLDLLNEIENPEALREAQGILIRCGAVSYCAYLLVDRYKRARLILDSVELHNPQPLIEVMDEYADSLITILQSGGVDLTRDQLLL
jgi:geranylgeranyl pyrophosphate synthase